MAVSLDYEKALGGTVLGIDEAGRGPLVGGVYAAAVSVPLDAAEALLTGAWHEINDSKKLSEKKRERLAEIITSTPGCTWAVASASPAEIDRLNILNATHLAMRRAADEVVAKLLGTGSGAFETPTQNSKHPNKPITFSILVDGLPVKTLPQAQNLVKGDAKSLFIAAASILAKTARDADCRRSTPATASPSTRATRPRPTSKPSPDSAPAPNTAGVSVPSASRPSRCNPFEYSSFCIRVV